jgi:hypothetical protein
VGGDANQHEVSVMADVKITITVPDAIERVTGPSGDEWRASFYDLHTEDDVLDHLAYNAVSNGIEDASRLDGWADLERGDVTMFVTRVDAL